MKCNLALAEILFGSIWNYDVFLLPRHLMLLSSVYP
jgi:hypothetical protein